MEKFEIGTIVMFDIHTSPACFGFVKITWIEEEDDELGWNHLYNVEPISILWDVDAFSWCITHDEVRFYLDWDELVAKD